MSIAGLATYQNRSMYYSVRNGSGNYDFGNGGSFMNQMLAFHREDSGVSQTEEGNRTSVDSDISSELQFGSIQGVSPIGAYGESKAYTRCITANIKTKEMLAHESDGQMVYSYQEEEKSFSIFINSDGKDKTYTIKGIDENGQEIEEEFDPYNLDPEMMDFPEFSALCMYIRQTDETADLMSKMVFTDTSYFNSIFEKGDRVHLLKDYAEEYREVTPSLADLANKLFETINTFFDRAMRGNGFSDEAFSLLFADIDDVETQEKISALRNRYTFSGTTTDPVSETIVSKHNQYTDPDTGEIVPVNVKYITAYTDQGISCKKISDVGGKISQRDLWSLSYDSPDSYEKVQEFLKSFSKDQNLTFAPQEKFWKDFMKGDFDIDGFRAYYDSTDNGKINVEKALQEGKKLGEVLTEPYAEYINNTHFIGKVFTEQEMWDAWNAKIEANQKAAMANGVGIESPTENSITKTGSSYEENPLPGFGMALAGNMGYGMKASLVSTGSTDDVIVRVKLATGGGNYESVDVNLSEFNPRNATAVEMFAYCQYKDAMGEGSGHTWGSWSAIKKVISPGDGMNFGSLENIMNEKRNWTGALAKSKTYMENPKSGETLSAADLLKMFEEQNKLTAEELKKGDDWRSMSEDDWDKLLSGVDNYIDAYKEEIREKVKKQMEAARKAAMEAEPEMRSTAAQEAALSAAASGFDGGDDSEGEEAAETMGEDPGIDHEKNWTKKLKTDDQTILRTAKAAQDMESMALNRMEEIASNGISTYDSYVGMAARYMRDRRLMGYA